MTASHKPSLHALPDCSVPPATNAICFCILLNTYPLHTYCVPATGWVLGALRLKMDPAHVLQELGL